MHKLLFLAGAIGLATITAYQPRVFAQSNVPIAKPLITTSPAPPPSINQKFNMFLDSGTPVRPSTRIEMKEAGNLSVKKGSEHGKIDPNKIQPPNLLVSPNADRKLAPHTASDQDGRYRVRVRFPHLDEKSAGERESKTLDMGKSKNTNLIGRSFLDPVAADRANQLRSGPGGINPNKP